MTGLLNLSAFLPYQLSMASNAVSDRIAGVYQDRFGLKIPEWRLLAVLGEGQPLSQRDLVRATLMDKVTVSRATAALVERDLVTRVASKSDGRSHLLRMTDLGKTLYGEIAPVAMAMQAEVFSCLSDTERAALTDMLARVREAAG